MTPFAIRLGIFLIAAVAIGASKFTEKKKSKSGVADENKNLPDPAKLKELRPKKEEKPPQPEPESEMDDGNDENEIETTNEETTDSGGFAVGGVKAK